VDRVDLLFTNLCMTCQLAAVCPTAVSIAAVYQKSGRIMAALWCPDYRGQEDINGR
jgi:hypothetical protein